MQMPIKNIYSGGMVIGDTYHRGGTISIVPYRMRSDTFNHKGFVFVNDYRFVIIFHSGLT